MYYFISIVFHVRLTSCQFGHFVCDFCCDFYGVTW